MYEIHTGNDEFLNPINSDNGLADYSVGIAICLNTGEISVSDLWRKQTEELREFLSDKSLERDLLVSIPEIGDTAKRVFTAHGGLMLVYPVEGKPTLTYVYTYESLIDRLVSYGKANFQFWDIDSF